VVVIGNSSEPWLAVKKDEKAFMSTWKKTLLLPLPDYASRRVRGMGLLAAGALGVPHPSIWQYP
jgi:hypothetical protein